MECRHKGNNIIYNKIIQKYRQTSGFILRYSRTAIIADLEHLSLSYFISLQMGKLGSRQINLFEIMQIINSARV